MKPQDEQLYDDYGNPITEDGDDAEELYDDNGQLIAKPTTTHSSVGQSAPAPTPVSLSPEARFAPENLQKGVRGSLTKPETWSNAARWLAFEAPRNALEAFDPIGTAVRGWNAEENNQPTTANQDFILGGAKGIGQSIVGLGKLVDDLALRTGPGGAFRKIADEASGGAGRTFGDFDRLNRDLGIEPEGGVQNLGFTAERIGEAMIPGSSVNRGITAASSGGRLAKLMVILGLESAAGFGTTMVQTGGDTETSAESALIGAGARGALSLPALLRTRPKEAQELMELAAKFNIPLDKVEQTQGRIGRFFKGFLKGTATGTMRFNKFDLDRNKRIAEVASKDLIDIANALPEREAGVFIRETLDEADKLSRTEIGAVADAVLSTNGSLNMRVAPDSELHQAASDLYKEWDVPFLEGTEEGISQIKQAKSILRAFIDVTKDVDSGVLDASGKPVVRQELKELTFAEARRIRSILFDITYSKNSSLTSKGEGMLKKLNQALDDEIDATLERAGAGNDLKLFRQANAIFREQRRLFESKVIEAMTAKQTSPEVILDMLLRKDAETRATNLRAIIGKEKMETVREALWARIVNPKSMSPDDVFLGDRLKKILQTMGPGAKEAIFGDQKLVKDIEDFAEIAYKLRVPANLHQRVEQGFIPLAGQFGARQIAGNIMNTVITAGAGATGGLMLGVGTGATLMLTPGILAWMMTRPGAAKDMAKALTTDATTTTGKALFAKLAAYYKQAKEAERRRKPIEDMNDWLQNPEHPDRQGKPQSKSALPPVPVPTLKPATQQREKNQATEWPADPNARDENDALFVDRSAESSFPAAVNIQKLVAALPPHFKNARKAAFGAPLSGRITTPTGENVVGVYGSAFDKKDQTVPDKRRPRYMEESNTVKIDPRANDSPGIWTHEVGHAVWDKDLTEEQRHEWAKYHNTAFRDGLDKLKGGVPFEAIGAPRAVMYYGAKFAGNSYNRYDESFAEMFNQYLMNPTAFKAAYPGFYGYFKRVFRGREYTQKPSNGPSDRSAVIPSAQSGEVGGSESKQNTGDEMSSEEYWREFNPHYGVGYEGASLLNEVAPADLLPDRFKHAKATVLGQEMSQGTIVHGGAGVQGVYGEPWTVEDRKNYHPFLSRLANWDKPEGYGEFPTVTLAREIDQASYPLVLMHEYGHAAWRGGDVTADEKKEWSKVHEERLRSGGKGGNTPRSIQYYADDPGHSFADMFGLFVVAPTEFKARYPEEYGFFRRMFGREYAVQAGAANRLKKLREAVGDE